MNQTQPANRSKQQQAKHTPGPWHKRVDHARPIWAWPLVGNDGTPVDQTSEANARLIAAAPELLAALNDTLAYIVSYAESADNDDPCHEMLKRWQALVAKAGGR